MTNLIVGHVTGTGSRMAGNPNSDRGQWEEQTVVVLSGMRTVEIKIGGGWEKFSGDRPTDGELVALEVGVDCYVTRAKTAAYRYVAFGRNTDVEAALTLAGSTSPVSLQAVKAS